MVEVFYIIKFLIIIGYNYKMKENTKGSEGKRVGLLRQDTGAMRGKQEDWGNLLQWMVESK